MPSAEAAGRLGHLELAAQWLAEAERAEDTSKKSFIRARACVHGYLGDVEATVEAARQMRAVETAQVPVCLFKHLARTPAKQLNDRERRLLREFVAEQERYRFDSQPPL